MELIDGGVPKPANWTENDNKSWYGLAFVSTRRLAISILSIFSQINEELYTIYAS